MVEPKNKGRDFPRGIEAGDFLLDTVRYRFFLSSLIA